VLKPMRVFRCHYICDECPNEFADEMLVIGPSWCPSCDKECEPYSTETLFDFAEDDEEEVA